MFELIYNHNLNIDSNDCGVFVINTMRQFTLPGNMNSSKFFLNVSL